MALVSRFLYQNRIIASGVVLVPSSADGAFPASQLRDQLRSKAWRSKLGWTIVAGFNDKIDFNRGGVKVATIAPGTYATGALLCVAIVAALEAADATPVWAASYSISTFKFTISSDLAFTLLFGSGANIATAPISDLGFASADTGSSTSQTGANAVYQSRHNLVADLGVALSVQAGIVIGHNAGTGGTFTLQGNNSNTWAAPTFTQNLSGDATVRIGYFSVQTLRYWRLLIDDCNNTAGYSEVGIWFAGPYSQPSVTYVEGLPKTYQELSEINYAVGGAHFQAMRARRRGWSPQWIEVVEADRVLIEACAAAMPAGKCFFFALQANVDATDCPYVYFTDGITVTLSGVLPYWDISMNLAEALG
jgi:hypothetical protein